MLIRIRSPRLFLALLLPSFVQLPASNAQNVEPFKFFRDYLGLKEDQIAAIRNGKAVAKVVESPLRMRCLYSAPCTCSRLPRNISSSLRTWFLVCTHPKPRRLATS